MADVLFLIVLVAFFMLCVGFVRICDRVIGVDATVAPASSIDDDERVAA